MRKLSEEPPLGVLGGGVRSFFGPFFGPQKRPKKGQNQLHSNFFGVFGALAVWRQNIKRKCSWDHFAIFSTTRGQTSSWQCCCTVGGFSAADQR